MPFLACQERVWDSIEKGKKKNRGGKKEAGEVSNSNEQMRLMWALQYPGRRKDQQQRIGYKRGGVSLVSSANIDPGSSSTRASKVLNARIKSAYLTSGP